MTKLTKQKLIKRDEDEYCNIIKWKMHQRTLNSFTSIYWTWGHFHQRNTIKGLISDWLRHWQSKISIPPSSPQTDHASRQKLNRNSDTDFINQMNLTDIYQAFHSNTHTKKIPCSLHLFLVSTELITKLDTKQMPAENSNNTLPPLQPQLIRAEYQI